MCAPISPNLHPRHHHLTVIVPHPPAFRPVIARSLRRSTAKQHREAAAQAHLAHFWESIGHTASREIATSLIAPRDDEEENRAVRWLRSYFDGAQHERRAGFGGCRRGDFSRPQLTRCHREESSTKRSRGFLGEHRTQCHPRDGLRRCFAVPRRYRSSR